MSRKNLFTFAETEKTKDSVVATPTLTETTVNTPIAVSEGTKLDPKNLKIESEELTIYYDMQCPYIYKYIEMIKQYCETNDVPVSFIQVDTLQKAKELPCVFNNFAVSDTVYKISSILSSLNFVCRLAFFLFSFFLCLLVMIS